MNRAFGFYPCLKIAVTAIACALCCGLPSQAQANDLKVRHRIGSSHGFLLLFNQAGTILATGELSEAPYAGDRVKTRVAFHFRDGSLDVETTTFSQKAGLRLINDHLIQRGKSFPAPCDMTIDVPTQRVTVRSQVKGKEVVTMEHRELPSDLVNGILFHLIENLQANDPGVEVSYLSTSAKPRMVKLAIGRDGEAQFKVGGQPYQALRYVIKVKLGGIAGVVAPMIGKQPSDTQVWVSKSSVPAIVRIDGSLYDEGPIWSIRLASPQW